MADTFRAGDVVQHGPSGEKWLLIVDEQHGVVVPGGWPDTHARAADCTIVDRANDGHRLAVLRSTAASKHSAAGLAKTQLRSASHG